MQRKKCSSVINCSKNKEGASFWSVRDTLCESKRMLWSLIDFAYQVRWKGLLSFPTVRGPRFKHPMLNVSTNSWGEALKHTRPCALAAGGGQGEICYTNYSTDPWSCKSCWQILDSTLLMLATVYIPLICNHRSASKEQDLSESSWPTLDDSCWRMAYSYIDVKQNFSAQLLHCNLYF